MPKYGIYAKAVELLCFKPALARLGGICKLEKRKGCFEFVPCLCNMDERSYRNDGGLLHRKKMLARGDDCCDFHVTRIK